MSAWLLDLMTSALHAHPNLSKFAGRVSDLMVSLFISRWDKATMDKAPLICKRKVPSRLTRRGRSC